MKIKKIWNLDHRHHLRRDQNFRKIRENLSPKEPRKNHKIIQMLNHNLMTKAMKKIRKNSLRNNQNSLVIYLIKEETHKAQMNKKVIIIIRNNSHQITLIVNSMMMMMMTMIITCNRNLKILRTFSLI